MVLFFVVYQLNFWRPSSDLQSLLKEGSRYKVYNLTTSDGKKHVGNTTVQLTGTKKTQFQDLPVGYCRVYQCVYGLLDEVFIKSDR